MKKILIIFGGTILVLLGLFFYSTTTNDGASSITVSGGVTSESQNLGYIVSQLIEHETDNKVAFLNNLGSANINQKAMERGDLDISSARYTGTDLIGTLGMAQISNANQALTTVQREFEQRYQQTWFPSYGFANQFSFMVTKETAAKYHLKKVSDLRKYAPNLTLGTDQTWYERPGDGYQAFSKKYAINFKRVYPMQIGIVYDALESKKLDVILGYSTDGRVGSYGLVMLEDDRAFFPAYTCSLVASDQVLKKHPELKPLLKRLDNKITTKMMQKMNYEADNDLVEPQVIAEKFLKENNYFETRQ